MKRIIEWLEAFFRTNNVRQELIEETQRARDIAHYNSRCLPHLRIQAH